LGEPWIRVVMANNATVVDHAYAELASGNIAAVLAVFDERIEWHNAERHPYRDESPTTVGEQQVGEHVFSRIH